jgi:WD40 repeat protein
VKMRFKIKKGGDRPKHSDIVSCVGWSSINDGTNELYSIGDDQQIHKWDIQGEHVSFTS